MASVQLTGSGPTGAFDWAVSPVPSDLAYVSELASALSETPSGGNSKPDVSFQADFQSLKPIDITFTLGTVPDGNGGQKVSGDAVFYLDPTIVNDTGHVWTGFSIQLVAVDPGQFWEFTDVHPITSISTIMTTLAPDFVDPQVGSLSIDGSEVYGYYSGVDPNTGEVLDSINEDSKAILSSTSLSNEIDNGDTEHWQDFGVHAPAADAPAAAGGQFTLELTPITDSSVFAAGNETLLNTATTGDQLPADYTSPASPSQLAALSDGEAVAVWDDGSSGEVEARIVSASGPVGQEITVGVGQRRNSRGAWRTAISSSPGGTRPRTMA